MLDMLNEGGVGTCSESSSGPGGQAYRSQAKSTGCVHRQKQACFCVVPSPTPSFNNLIRRLASFQYNMIFLEIANQGVATFSTAALMRRYRLYSILPI